MMDGVHETVGPPLWANWKSQERGLRIHESFEAEILTDYVT
jgi:hypothetical protein